MTSVDLWWLPFTPPPPTTAGLTAHHQHQRATTHAALRRLLASCLGIPPHHLKIESDLHGKPHLRPEPGRPPIHFNLSHASTLSLIALCNARELGVDVESALHPPRLLASIQRYLSPADQQQIDKHPQRLLRLWTRKEAYAKALGLGLSLPLDAPLPSNGWTLIDLDLPAGHIGALAVAGEGIEVHHRGPLA